MRKITDFTNKRIGKLIAKHILKRQGADYEN
jgi:hypothetical protein